MLRLARERSRSITIPRRGVGHLEAKRVAVVCAAVAAGAMGLCQAAWAGSVGIESVNNRGQYDAYFYFTGAAGEANDATLTLTPATAAITDLGNPLQADPAFEPATSRNCTFAIDKAVCRSEPGHALRQGVLRLGDGDDRGRVTVTAPNQGTLISHPLQTGALYGGPGADALIGSAAGDGLEGGPGADDMRGGAGRDWVAYAWDADQTSGLTITLDGSADDGRPGEHDNVHGDVEIVYGLRDSDNVMTGNAADNSFFAYHGNDVLRGGAGNDHLVGSFGSGPGGSDTLDGGLGLDTFIGGDGDDTIHARDGLPDLRITCNGGNDTVEADPNDPVDSDCETVRRG